MMSFALAQDVASTLDSPSDSSSDFSSGTEFESLFEKYQKNNTSYQKSLYELESAKYSLEKTRVQNGFYMELSSGNITTDCSSVLSVSPEVTVGSTEWNNTKLSVEVPYTMRFSESEVASSIEDAEVLVSTDIFSSTGKSSKLALEKANRNVEEARRNLMNTKISVHMEFLNELKSIFESRQAIYEAENDLLDEQIEFNTIKAQGYASQSAKYRTANLEVESARRKVEEKQRVFDSSLAVFASKCSVQIESIDLDMEIPEVQLAKFSDLEKENFTKIENAKWDLYINKKEREIDTTKALSAQAGYGLSAEDSNITNSIKAGATLNLDGFAVSALANIPIASDQKTSLTMSVAWNPFKRTENELSKKIDNLSTKTDELSVKDALEEYRTQSIEKEENRLNLDWQLSQYAEELELYRELEKDTLDLYEKGLVTESEWRTAKINAASANAKLSETKLERILYNDELISLFIKSSGDNDGKKENNAE